MRSSKPTSSKTKPAPGCSSSSESIFARGWRRHDTAHLTRAASLATVVRKFSTVVAPLGVAVLAVVAVVSLLAPPAAAEAPSDVAVELADDGVYISPRRSSEAEPGAYAPVVQDARVQGLTVGIVWPHDPQPNTGAFARRVQEITELDVVLVFGPDDVLGAHVSEDYEDGAVRALSAARAESSPVEQAEAYLVGLTDEPVREQPAIIGELVRWIAILLAALVVAAVCEQMIRQFKRLRKRRALERHEREVV